MIVDFYAFSLVALTAVLLIAVGLKFRMLGGIGGMLLFVLFVYMVSFNVDLTAPGSATVIMNFGLSTSNFMFGAYGLFGAGLGLAVAFIWR